MVEVKTDDADPGRFMVLFSETYATVFETGSDAGKPFKSFMRMNISPERLGPIELIGDARVSMFARAVGIEARVRPHGEAPTRSLQCEIFSRLSPRRRIETDTAAVCVLREFVKRLHSTLEILHPGRYGVIELSFMSEPHSSIGQELGALAYSTSKNA
jgi:hypothetical protein